MFVLWYRRFCRPRLGMEMTNLYAASVDKLEKIVQKFPNIFKGVIVEEVCSLLHPCLDGSWFFWGNIFFLDVWTTNMIVRKLQKN